MNGFLIHEACDAVGQLNFIPRTALRGPQLVEDSRRQQIAPHHGQIGRGVLGVRLLDDSGDPARAGWLLFHRNDAVTGRAFRRYGLHRKHTAAVTFEMTPHLRKAGRRTVDEIVGQVHVEGFIADRRTGAKHRVTQPQRYALAHKNAARRGRKDPADRGKQFGLSRLRK